MGGSAHTDILDAAEGVFLRHGFKRATMGDLAEAAGVSRPGLYLRFCNKEEVFRGVLKAFAERHLAEVRAGLADQPGPEAQLRFAFEVWAVRPFAQLLASPESRELMDCGFAFAREVIEDSLRAFEAEVARILAPLCAAAPPPAPDPALAARILTRAVAGLKHGAESPEALREQVHGLLGLALAGLAPRQAP